VTTRRRAGARAPRAETADRALRSGSIDEGVGDVRRDVGHRCLDELHLAGEAIDQLGPVAAGDGELGLAQQRCLEGDLALVALGVDDPYTRGRDGNVADVGAAAGDAAVVQQEDARRIADLDYLAETQAERLAAELTVEQHS
jgi:hypothetical protein